MRYLQARNQPDFYETTNLVPSANNDHGELNEDNSPNVEKIKISTKEARDKYSGSKPFNSELVGKYVRRRAFV